MFVDASAMVAIITSEPEADNLADLLEAAESRITSPVALFEAALAISRKRSASPDSVIKELRDFLDLSRIEIVSITESDAYTALDAHWRFGKGRAHPARLNLGDCFAYAIAKNHSIPLLYKGQDFEKTDIRTATTRPH